MIFPRISTAASPFPPLGSGQSTARSDPPRTEIDGNTKRLAAVARPPRMVRVYVVGLSTATMLHRAIHAGALMIVPALPVGPQPRVRFPSHRPISCLSRSSGRRIVEMPGARCRTAQHCGLAGPTVHRRAVPGHIRHHRPNRKLHRCDRWCHRRRPHRDASTSADPHRGRGAPLSDLHSTRRHAPMSDPDQEPGEPRPYICDLNSPLRPLSHNCARLLTVFSAFRWMLGE
jgi:hypothetical protein